MISHNRYRFLSEKGFKGLVNGLLRDFMVFGTIRKDGHPAFSGISDYEELVLEQTPTHLSAKEFFFPPKEVLLRFRRDTGEHEAVVQAPRQAIIGLHACDVHALSLMDSVFAHGTPDANYLARRKNTVIIATDCFPDKFCFCESLGNMEAHEGFDIFVHPLRKGYLVRTGSREGARLLKKHAGTRAAKPSETRELDDLRLRKAASFKARLNASPELLPSVYQKSDSSPVWDRIGSICYGCGSCNNVCPTCYCFDVKDEVHPNLVEGERVRVWDGCTLEEFAKVAGGHNFRKTRGQRLRHRFNRKFRFLSDVFGALFCVGCGRCSRTCLVNINISEVTNELISETISK